VIANELKRAVRNLIHAAGDPEEATQEIAYWFPEGEFIQYKATAEEVMF